MTIETLNDVFRRTLSLERPAIMKVKRNGVWTDITIEEFHEQVRRISLALRALGVKNGDRVAILSENRPEWTITDFAILACGAVSVPIYPTLLAWQIEYIINDAGCVAVFASDEEQVKKITETCDHCPTIHNIIAFDPITSQQPKVRTFQSMLDLGAEVEREEGTARFEEGLRSKKAGDLATLVYTSGTTGNPKGAMLSHGNLTSNIVTTAQLVPMKQGFTTLSILPLSHILERMVDFTILYVGGCIAYAENLTKVSENLAEVKPDTFAAVPRLFEKMQARVMDNVAAAPAARQKIFHWALGVAKARLPYMVERKPLPPALAAKSFLADKLVFRKIHERLGGRVQFVISGGAPLSADLAAFFIGAGVEILEGYGLTETSPVISCNTLTHRRIGTVGRVIPGVEVKIASDGEILARGPNIMQGYFNNPEATAQSIDGEGWFHTGDIGEIDSDGFLRITDRKKDLIINAYGKNIAPQPLEGLLKSSPYIATPVLIGDRRKYLAALIVPNFEKLERDLRAKGGTFSSRQELVASPAARSLVQAEIDRFNEKLDRQEKIRRFTLLADDFTIESGEITPSMKVKRKVVDEKFKSLIDQLYVENGESDEANA
jgi:long-chain acyl-CoA synthetase